MGVTGLWKLIDGAGKQVFGGTYLCDFRSVQHFNFETWRNYFRFTGLFCRLVLERFVINSFGLAVFF